MIKILKFRQGDIVKILRYEKKLPDDYDYTGSLGEVISYNILSDSYIVRPIDKEYKWHNAIWVDQKDIELVESNRESNNNV